MIGATNRVSQIYIQYCPFQLYETTVKKSFQSRLKKLVYRLVFERLLTISNRNSYRDSNTPSSLDPKARRVYRLTLSHYQHDRSQSRYCCKLKWEINRCYVKNISRAFKLTCLEMKIFLCFEICELTFG